MRTCSTGPPIEQLIARQQQGDFDVYGGERAAVHSPFRNATRGPHALARRHSDLHPHHFPSSGC
jgi:hypothetical protein